MSSESPPFTLRVLGTPGIEGPDGPVDLPLGKPMALLCYLAIEPTAVRRSDLARILWSSSPEPRAKASIRQALWLIRKQTDGDIVREEDGELTLDPTLVHTDLAELARDLAQGRVEEAFERWSGGPLAGFGIPDARAWLAWADRVRSRWEVQLGQAIEDQAAASTGEERIDWLRRAVEVRPYRVEAWFALVQALVDLRDVESADQALARMRHVADEGDLELVREAEERIRLLRRTAYGDPSERLVPEFVGRSEEFSTLMRAWRSALSGRSRLVGITGEAGIGKSALAAEALRHAEVDEGQVVEVRAVRAETDLEFGVVASTVADLIRRPGAAGTSPGSAQALRALVPSDGDQAAPVPRATTLADALADLLDAVSHEAPVMLLVEDAHWIDGPSAIVLLRAVRQLRGARVMMIWTCRPGEDEAPNRGAASLRAAAEGGHAELLELDPLREAEVREMVALLLADSDPDVLSSLADRVHFASGGSPFHIVEILQGLRDRGVLGLDHEGRWTLADDVNAAAIELPTSLSEALARRVDDLSADARRLGAAWAALEGPQTPDALGAASGLDPSTAEDAVRTLLTRGLVRWTRDDRLELAHAELAEAFRRRTPTDTKGEAPPPLRRWAGFGLAAIVALVTLSIVWPRPTPESPYGGGTIWIRKPDMLLGLQLRGAGDWMVSDSVPLPEGPFVVQAGHPVSVRVGDSWEPALIGYLNREPLEAPDAAMVRGDRLDVVFDGSGDSGFGVMAPNGRAGMVNAQPPDTTEYRMQAVRVDLEGRQPPRVVAAGLAHYKAFDWSPDARHVLIQVDAPHDTVLVVDPGGRRVASMPAPPGRTASDLHFCGPNHALIGFTPPGELIRHALWAWREGTLTFLETDILPEGGPSCSPDGSAVAYLGMVDDALHLIVDDLESGARISRRVGTDATHVRWARPQQVVPDRVEIREAPTVLGLGERSRASAEVIGTDGRAMDRAATWSSSDAAIVSVTANGRLIANRPGVVQVRAFVDGWIGDSVEVVVAPQATRSRLALADSFSTIDPARWTAVGDPIPEATVDDEGRPALELTGDGRYQDGITSVDPFDLTVGATLEATFRLDAFARPDRNRILLCLADGRPGDDPADWAQWRLRQQACLQWPAANGVTDMDTAAVALWISDRPLGAVPVDTLLRTGRWNRMAIQMRADGVISAVVGDSVVAVHPIPALNDSTAEWHVVIRGASVDTRLLLRDVTLWTEERYGPGSNGGGDPSPGGSPP